MPQVLRSGYQFDYLKIRVRATKRINNVAGMILSAPKVHTILISGALRKGERLMPPSALDLLLRVTLPSSSARAWLVVHVLGEVEPLPDVYVELINIAITLLFCCTLGANSIDTDNKENNLLYLRILTV
ncbi:hypothetical protein CTI12_AA274660 [Artemisia annua]|uniref:Uncharacterized protein n=1 Tax=Artemisia annua TaxID=35608 RepID=A0A2U1NES5_ARTAN|nr:hypothetical protein CTI12_AA274660 [Artemisia annua]